MYEEKYGEYAYWFRSVRGSRTEHPTIRPANQGMCEAIDETSNKTDHPTTHIQNRPSAEPNKLLSVQQNKQRTKRSTN